MTLVGWKLRTPYVTDRVWEGTLSDIPEVVRLTMWPLGRSINEEHVITIVATQFGPGGRMRKRPFTWTVKWAQHLTTVNPEERARRTRKWGKVYSDEEANELIPTDSLGLADFS